MACVSTVTATFSGKQIQHIQFCCSGHCAAATALPCCVQISYNAKGGTRTWCGCGPEEPKECHIVVVHPSPTAPPEILCAGVCAQGQKCELKKTEQGNAIVFSCECEKG
jgi:hypothetical protein